MQKNHLIVALILYLASSAATYGVLAQMKPKDASKTQSADVTDQKPAADKTMLGSLLQISPDEPRDQKCPLNGKMYTQTEQAAWAKRRPLFVMIENAPDARPQSGLTSADVVFEVVAEGGVTRFGAIFYCGVQANDTTLAPIRSARTYFVDWASGFNRPMYVHVGGANTPGPANALGQISDYGWNQQNDMNQFSVGYPTFVRDYERIAGKEIATEHTMVTTTELLWKIADKRGWTNMSPTRKVGKKEVAGTDWKDGYKGWKFQTEVEKTGSVNKISYDFWSGYGQYSIQWDYDSATNQYARTMGGEKHLNLEDNKQIMASSVIVMLTTEKGPIDENKHMLYTTTGKGDALLFKNGDVFKVTWSKKDREAELLFMDSKGKEVELAPGLIWISVLPKSNEVQY